MEEKPSEPSLLEYARFYGISTDPRAVHPFEYVENTYEPTHQLTPELPSAFIEKQLFAAHSLIEESARREKLSIDKEDAQFLSKVIRFARTTKIEIDWESHLRSRYRGVRKLDVPLLKRDADNGFNVASSRKARQSLFDYGCINLSPVVTGSQSLDDLGFLDDVFHEAGEIAKRIQKEKLDCSRDSLLLIQNVKRYANLDAGDGVEKCFDSLLESNPTRSISRNHDLLHNLDFEDVPCRSPATDTKTHMLPSPASSDVIEITGLRYGGAPDSFQNCRQPSNTNKFQGHYHKQSDDVSFQQIVATTDDFVNTPSQNGSLESSWKEKGKDKDTVGVEQADMLTMSAAETCEKSIQTPKERQAQQGKPSSESERLNSAACPQEMNVATLHGSVQGSRNDSDDIVVFFSSQAQSQSPRIRPDGKRVSPTEDTTKPQNLKTSLEQSACQTEYVEETFTQPQHPEKGHSSVGILIHSGPGSMQAEEAVCENNSPSTREEPSKHDLVELKERVRKQIPEIDLNASTCAEIQGISRDEYSPMKGLPCVKSNDVPRSKKRRRDKTISRKKRKLCTQAKITTSKLGKPQNARPKPSASAPLGSLSRFMETRGIAVEPRKVESGSYFTNTESNPEDSVVDEHMPATNDAGTEIGQGSAANVDTYTHALDIDAIMAPQNRTRTRKPPVLLLSASLLKSHLQLIRILEDMPNPPTLVYRDYNKCHRPYETLSPFSVQKNHCTTKPPETIPEADIIISPSVGIILTTSQAMTQLYLPGHRPSCPLTRDIKGINSPLRERIFRVSLRYEQLYVLICQPVDTGKDNAIKNHRSAPQAKPASRYPRPTADMRTLSSIGALSAFCSSLVAETQLQGCVSESGRGRGQPESPSQPSPAVTPLIVPAIPDNIIDWIFALADKHAFKLPGGYPIEAEERLLPSCQTSIGFTPINTTSSSIDNLTPKLPAREHREHAYPNPYPYINFQQEETHWEVFLREAGLNPFAAQTILGVLDNHQNKITGEVLPPIAMQHGRGISTTSTHDTRCGHNGGCCDGWNERHGEDVPALSRFIEMSPDERRCLFKGLIGGRVLERVEAVIDKDWQCDWALDFDVYGG